MTRLIQIGYILFFLCFSTFLCQPSSSFSVVSWNVENLFDVVSDLNKNDDDFTIDGSKKWDSEKMNTKIANLAKVLSLIDDEGPDIIGFMEVEHKGLLDTLFSRFFDGKKYKVVGYESPDERGIDNYLAYKTNKFELVSFNIVPVKFFSDDYLTRDILHVELEYYSKTLDLFINHWPSRRGGEQRSQPRRINAASVLKQEIDSLNEIRTDPSFIIMGDFNDEPNNYSLQNILMAGEKESDSYLVNLTWPYFEKGIGTHLFQGDFNMLDHIIISKSLMNEEGIEFKNGSFNIFSDNSFIYTKGKRTGAIIPSFENGKYIGGFSDHLPLVSEFYLVKE